MVRIELCFTFVHLIILSCKVYTHQYYKNYRKYSKTLNILTKRKEKQRIIILNSFYIVITYTNN